MNQAVGIVQIRVKMSRENQHFLLTAVILSRTGDNTLASWPASTQFDWWCTGLSVKHTPVWVYSIIGTLPELWSANSSQCTEVSNETHKSSLRSSAGGNWSGCGANIIAHMHHLVHTTLENNCAKRGWEFSTLLCEDKRTSNQFLGYLSCFNCNRNFTWRSVHLYIGNSERGIFYPSHV